MQGKSKRGFGAMSPEKQRAIASKGGQAAHRKGAAHEFTLEEARQAGHLGGKIVGANREHMAAIGRKGGQRTASGHRLSAAHTREESWSQQSAPSATDLLRMDHRFVNELFHKVEMQAEHHYEARVTLVQQICAELDVHAQLEEELFYPAVKARVSDDWREKIDEGIKEHQRIKDLIVQVRHMAVDEADYLPTVEQLHTCVERHVQEEERDILPVAEEQFSEELLQLGRQIQQRKQELTRPTPPSHHASEQAEPEATRNPSPPHEYATETSH
jgi:general stress protein YciG